MSRDLLLSRTFHLVLSDSPKDTSILFPCAFTRACRCGCRADPGVPKHPLTALHPCGSSQSVSITKQLPCEPGMVPVVAVRDHNYRAYQLPCLLQAHKAKSCLKLCGLCSHGALPVPGAFPHFVLLGIFPLPFS